jgi:hypothetical protein
MNKPSEIPETEATADGGSEAKTAEAKGPMGRKGFKPSWWQTFHALPTGRLARISTFVCVLIVAGVWLAYERTAAQIGDGLLNTGDALLDYAETTPTDGPRVLRMNGESVHLESGSTERSLDDLLTWFETECLARDGQLVEQLEDTVTSMPDHPRARSLVDFSPVIRREAGAGGIVACLDLGTERRTYSELLAAYDRFQESHDIHELGDIRYLFARNGHGNRTHFVSLWTEGSFNVERALPDGEEAEGGEEIGGVVRAPGMRRVLTAWEEGRDERFVLYRGSNMTEWELEHFYETSLSEAGWMVQIDSDDALAEAGRDDDTRTVLAMRDGRQLYVLLDTDRLGFGSATVMLTE